MGTNITAKRVFWVFLREKGSTESAVRCRDIWGSSDDNPEEFQVRYQTLICWACFILHTVILWRVWWFFFWLQVWWSHSNGTVILIRSLYRLCCATEKDALGKHRLFSPFYKILLLKVSLQHVITSTSGRLFYTIIPVAILPAVEIFLQNTFQWFGSLQYGSPFWVL